MLQIIQSMFNDVMVVGSLVGFVVLVTGVLDGIFMIWDKIVHGIPILDRV